MRQRLSERLRSLGYAAGGKLLNSNGFSWILIVLRKVGVIRLVHTLLDGMEARHPTEEMLRFQRIKIEHRKEIRKVYNLLEDEKSRTVYQDILRYRCTKNRRYLVGHIEKKMYFNELTMKGQRDVFVDGGAFNGDTVKMFCRMCGGGYRHIYAFEVDKKNIQKMRSVIQKKHLTDITIEPYALWNKREVLCVSDDGGMIAKVSSERGGSYSQIQAESMDNLLGKKEITFIKMDIESAEQKALEGAEDIIRMHKPKLAISIYHKPEDFYKIPLYIHKLVPEYKFYVRHYTCFHADTVLYAVCE